MADVNYAGVSNKEPKVSVSGIPQSQYQPTGGDPAAGPAQGGGIVGNIKRHWPVYTVVLAIITIIVIIWVNNNNASSTSSLVGNGSTSTGTAGTLPDQSSQLDADYQEMMSLQNQTNSFLQTLVNNSANSTSTGNTGQNFASGGANPGWNLPSGGRLISTVNGNSTLASIAKYAHWTPAQVYNYGNNAEVFANEGIHSGDINKKINQGTVYAI